MKKYFALFIATLLLTLSAFFQSPAVAQSDQSTPEASVKAFYTWYFKRDEKGYPLLDNAILHYMAKDTVTRLRYEYHHNSLPDGHDYFTKVQDYDEKDWAANIAPQSAIMFDDVALVPVVLGVDKDGKKLNLVFLRKEGNAWKITKIDDTQDYK
ncbi:DUF3828 domain-containing protein [Paraburkholderia sp.]|uniref:DUF3828 domain-containing protein n=1 Tax=Paraburkholderia sp. TaxID=1926495 RepID=UPI003D6F6BAB